VTLAHELDGPEDAPVLVLPSSLGTTRELWQPQVETFARTFRVLRYEHRGHGDSPVPGGAYTMEELARDALALLDGLGLARVSWCGLSLGGMVAMWLGAHAPERLDALVLACTSARVPTPDAYRERAATVREVGIEPVADAVVGKWFAAATFRERPELPARFREVLVSTPREGYAGCCDALAAWDFRDGLADIAVPTLVIAGDEDEATPSGDTDLLAERIPDARLVTLDGAGHLANLERPRAFADAALAHLLEVA
jgi:3-oxoadipate enol-lactonase